MDMRERAHNENLRLWDAWTQLHFASAFYDVEGFRRGGVRLTEIELGEVGTVAGKSLLHLQCHFGLDTLSWARLGARVTGVDFSARAVDHARRLAEDLALDARFIECDVYHLPEVLQEQFDIVFTSYGVLPWLPDLDRWAHIAAAFVKPGGFLYLAEFHPAFDMLSDSGELQFPYFNRGPIWSEVTGSYAGGTLANTQRECTWSHALSEVIGALLGAGLRLEFLHEHSFSPYPIAPHLEEVRPGRWMVRGRHGDLPIVYSLKARRD